MKVKIAEEIIEIDPQVANFSALLKELKHLEVIELAVPKAAFDFFLTYLIRNNFQPQQVYPPSDDPEIVFSNQGDRKQMMQLDVKGEFFKALCTFSIYMQSSFLKTLLAARLMVDFYIDKNNPTGSMHRLQARHPNVEMVTPQEIKSYLQNAPYLINQMEYQQQQN